jgi:hypothetical protein
MRRCAPWRRADPERAEVIDRNQTEDQHNELRPPRHIEKQTCREQQVTTDRPWQDVEQHQHRGQENRERKGGKEHSLLHPGHLDANHRRDCFCDSRRKNSATGAVEMQAIEEDVRPLQIAKCVLGSAATRGLLSADCR